MRGAIIEPAISQDVLALGEVRKPALMRALFRLAVAYSAQELSYTKMLGQLQDSGNTVTIAHYLDLLGKAGMVTSIPKFSDKEMTKRRSPPRLMVYDTSLMTAPSDKVRDLLMGDHALRGHLVESAVGARLLHRGLSARPRPPVLVAARVGRWAAPNVNLHPNGLGRAQYQSVRVARI